MRLDTGNALRRRDSVGETFGSFSGGSSLGPQLQGPKLQQGPSVGCCRASTKGLSKAFPGLDHLLARDGVFARSCCVELDCLGSFRRLVPHVLLASVFGERAIQRQAVSAALRVCLLRMPGREGPCPELWKAAVVEDDALPLLQLGEHMTAGQVSGYCSAASCSRFWQLPVVQTLVLFSNGQ